MRSVRVIHRSLLVAVLVTAVVGTQAPAGASDRAETHCVVRAIGELADGQLVTTRETCFGTLAEAMTFASGNAVQFDEDLTGADLLANKDGVASLVSTFTLGVHFDGYNGTGSSISIVGSDCAGGYWNTGAAWKDRISSSWNGCYRLRHYPNPNRIGISESTVGMGATHNLGTLNNDTESVAYLGS